VNGYRLLVCVDRSAAALEAARLSVRMAGRGGRIRVVSVIGDGEDVRTLRRRMHRSRRRDRSPEQDVQAVLQHVRTMATDRGTDVETVLLHGDPLQTIIRDARRWNPDMVLIGRTRRSGPGSPLIGSLAMHVVEFSEWPVIIVPAAPTTRAEGATSW
jgi:nucleotide-binding universal stress UspA family protein